MNRPTFEYSLGAIISIYSFSHPIVKMESLVVYPYPCPLVIGVWLPRPISPRYEHTRVSAFAIYFTAKTPSPAPSILDLRI